MEDHERRRIDGRGAAEVDLERQLDVERLPAVSRQHVDDVTGDGQGSPKAGTTHRLALKSDAAEGEVVLTLDWIVRKVGTDGSCGTQVEDFDLVGRLKLRADARGDQKLGIA